MGSFQSSMARQVNEGVRIKRSKADTLMNSKSEFQKHPLVRVIPNERITAGARRGAAERERS